VSYGEEHIFPPRSRQFPKIRQNVFQQVWGLLHASERREVCTRETTMTLKIERLALKEVALADAEAVRFLGACESEPFISNIARHTYASGSSESAGSKVSYSVASLPGVTIGSLDFDF
jgi:hypothetical protein